MRPLVVLFAIVAVALAAPVGEHEVQKRSIGHAVAYAVPSAVSHQSRVDVHSSPGVVATAPVYSEVLAEPVLEARAVYAAPAATVYAGGSAVSHQSRVDVKTSPAVVATSPVFAAPVVAEPVLAARSVYASPVAVYAAPSAVSHQSRVDVHNSPALVETVYASPVVDARSVWAPSVYTSSW